ncbi:farnesol dehydrogenase [Halyomorpha halys]|uniref:farnesol dehydrogenase n=1 Tax=Halyomorpha halys TaxID=286706 RepID=UPI0006D4FBD8|nr:farnesol dehydrogenase-like [Halyomorpha halys]
MEALKQRVAVVTGASEGIGEAIVRRLAAEGMKVAALARRIDKLTELENDLKGRGYTVKGYICDVQKEGDVQAAFRSIEEDFGAITLLVNNAGVSKNIKLDDINLDDVNTLLNTNVVGVLACTKEGLASMKTHSVDRGHIVIINSVAGHRDLPFDTISVYTASKKAITSLCTSLRNHLKPSKIRVTSISPGLVKTKMTKGYMDQVPNLPHLLASDVADAVVYAVSAPLNVNVSELILDTTS